MFDLGGGTLDVSLLEVGNGTIEVLSTGLPLQAHANTVYSSRSLHGSWKSMPSLSHTQCTCAERRKSTCVLLCCRRGRPLRWGRLGFSDSAVAAAAVPAACRCGHQQPQHGSSAEGSG